MPIQSIAIAGAGIMGASIAQIFARYGYSVALYDIDPASIGRAKDLIRLNQHTAVAQGEFTEEQSAAIIGHISHHTQVSCFAAADFVIEAIVEKLEVKQAFWSQVSALVTSSAILTSNTSGLSITAIARAVKHPGRFCGMHWVNPPHIIPLVEVICGDNTAPETAREVRDLAAAIGKKPVLVQKDAQGFVLNRIQFAVLREAIHIVESGIASVEDVDKVLKYGLGMRYAAIGPFETADLGGLDTFYNIASYLFADLSDAKTVPPLLARLYEKGAFGVKTGSGFYDYADGKDQIAIHNRDVKFLKIASCLYKEELSHRGCDRDDQAGSGELPLAPLPGGGGQVDLKLQAQEQAPGG